MGLSSKRPSTWLEAARDQWRWRGQQRPVFAPAPRYDQFAVWD